jgi:membrane protein
MIGSLHKKLDLVVWGDVLENRGFLGRTGAKLLRYLYALLRDMFAGQLMLRAMSLVYTTLLSVVPLVAFSFSVLKGLGYHNKLEPLLFPVFEPLGEQGGEILRQIIDLVDNVEGGVLGGVSLAFFIYTTVSMVQKVEESLNYVWYVAKPRNLARRLTEYIVVMLIGPVVIVIALSMIVSLQSTAIVQFFLSIGWLEPVFRLSSKLTPYLLVTAVFTFLYMFIPNTRVRFRSALVGGIASGFIWASLSAIFATFVVYSTRIQLIYSGFAIAIVTLIWLYLNWLILLVGSQLAFYHQNPAFLRLGHREPRLSNSVSERLALNIMLLVGQAFRKPGEKITVRWLAEALHIPSISLAPILASLEAEGLLMTTEKERLVPGREMARITLSEILTTVRQHGDTGSYRKPRWSVPVQELCDRLDSAIASTVSEQTLAGLLDDVENLQPGLSDTR